MFRNSQKTFKKFLLLWSGEFISAIGSGLTSFGLGVYIFQQTGKASAMALVTFLAFVPSLLLGPIAGVLADRYDRRMLMVLGDSLSITGLLFILFCLSQGEAQLWQICVGVTISSIFISLLEPSYKATITDLLDEEQYTKASGFIQIAGSAKYLVSPILAGYLLSIADIRWLLLIDICTFFITVFSTLIVRSGLAVRNKEKTKKLSLELKEGWSAVSGNKGVFLLMMMGAVMTFFLGFIETLSLPMILAFSSSSTAGLIETLVASGMLVSSLLIGMISIKKGYVRLLSVSLFLEGVFVIFFGLRENILLIGISGFLFFAMMPFVNASLDFLIRTNIKNSVQGRAWALIGLVSQLGFVAAYAFSGLLADYGFTPLLLDGGLLSQSLGRVFGTGPGRGIGLLISTAGLFLCLTAVFIYNAKLIKKLENRGKLCL